eukprot:TRINITY_DN117_c3_g3_i1.p1 TRINITY_DN117_c3_g3~~TRINITY_DN117_c3_g3_i1.p1  ORF type:complete len:553 (-),score=330.12 TRINITY_DN117_c3_g3_i1:117-1742(-)
MSLMIGGGLSQMLKDGTKHLSGLEEAILRNIEACKQLTQVTRTSLGPNGQNKMVITQHDKLIVTSDAATIIKELEVIHPAAKMVVLASQMQDQEIGDGTNLVVVLAGELLQQAESLIRMGLHPSDIISGYSSASKKALEILEELATIKCNNIRDTDEVIKFLKSTVAAKQYGWEDILTPLITNACIQALPREAINFSVDNVRVAKISGGGISDSKYVKGFAIARDTEGTIKHVKKAKVAVFAAGFDIAKTETKGVVAINSAKQLENYTKGEEKMMEDLINQIADTGVNVIISGGPIADIALHFIERRQILIIKIQSKFDIRRACKATGATPLVRMGAPMAEEIGTCDEVSVDEVSGSKICIFKQDSESSGISTIIVRASTENMLADIERCIDDSVSVFKSVIRDARFVPGAGACEIELAKRLTTFGESTPGLEQYAIKKFAEAFEVIPRTLAENAGLTSTDIISSLYSAHHSGKVAEGIDVDEGQIRSAIDMSVFDSFLTKYWAIKYATDAAITILRVDQIIVAKAAGGPKVPNMAARDEE